MKTLNKTYKKQDKLTHYKKLKTIQIYRLLYRGIEVQFVVYNSLYCKDNEFYYLDQMKILLNYGIQMKMIEILKINKIIILIICYP